MREPEAIYRTVFEVEVFSRGPWHPDQTGDEDPFDLAAINYAITEGDCIGNVRACSSEVVPADQVKHEMVRIGNDGTFFDDPFAEAEDDA